MNKENPETENPQTPGLNIRDKRRIHIDYEAEDSASGSPENSSDAGASGDVTEFSVSVPDTDAVITELHNKLAEAEAKRLEAERERDDLVDRFRKGQIQIKAENDELRQRLQRSFEQKLEAARGELVASLLDVLDSLKLAVSAASVHQNKGSEFDSLLGGVRVTAQMFESKLMSMGASPVNSTGEIFNPELHEAVEMVPVDASQDGRVVDEMQTGYKFGDRLLRPARVRVGKAAAQG